MSGHKFFRMPTAAAALLCFAVGTPALAAGLCATQSDTLENIRNTGQIRIGFRSASIPFSYLPNQLDRPQPDRSVAPDIPAVTIDRQTGAETSTIDGLPRGYSIDLCLEVVDEIMTELELPQLEVAFVAIDPSSRFRALNENLIDLECGSTSITVARSRNVDFSHVIFVTGTKLLVRRSLVEEILGARAKGKYPERGLEIEDLEGRRVAVADQTTNLQALERIHTQAGAKFKHVTVPDHDAGIDMLLADKVDAYASDDILLYGLKQKLEGTARLPDTDALMVTGRFLSYDLYGLAMRQNNSCFRLIVNQRLSRLFRTGQIGAIYKKWFGSMDAMPSRLFRSAITLQATPLGK